MKQQRGERGGGGGAPAVLLADRGPKSQELGAVLEALARVRSGGDVRLSLEHIEDVEDLLAERNGSGTLILEYGRVPAEDIGFVRRFLERSPTWRLFVLGEDAQDHRARGLLGLPRASWLPWPPDLEQLASLLGAEGRRPGPRRVPEEPAGAAAPARAPAPAKGERVAGVFDVSGLLEELLAGYSLSGAGAPRFLYRCDETLRLAGDAEALQDGLDGLLQLARACAGEGQVVNVEAGPGPSGEDVRVRIDFPLGPLTDADLPGLLEGGFDGAQALAEGVEAARRGARVLEAQGAGVELVAQRPGRLRLEARLPGRAR